MQESHIWFNKAVARWLDIALYKAMQRIIKVNFHFLSLKWITSAFYTAIIKVISHFHITTPYRKLYKYKGIMSCRDVVKGSKTTFILLSDIWDPEFYFRFYFTKIISGCGTRRPFSCGRPGEALELCGGYPHCAHAGHFYDLCNRSFYPTSEDIWYLNAI